MVKISADEVPKWCRWIAVGDSAIAPKTFFSDTCCQCQDAPEAGHGKHMKTWYHVDQCWSMLIDADHQFEHGIYMASPRLDKEQLCCWGSRLPSASQACKKPMSAAQRNRSIAWFHNQKWLILTQSRNFWPAHVGVDSLLLQSHGSHGFN